MAALGPEPPRSHGTHCEGDRRNRGGETQGGEAGSGEIEEVGHGEGIVAYAAVGEEFADIRDEGEFAGAPEAVAQCRCGGDTDHGVSDVRERDPASGEKVFVVA